MYLGCGGADLKGCKKTCERESAQPVTQWLIMYDQTQRTNLILNMLSLSLALCTTLKHTVKIGPACLVANPTMAVTGHGMGHTQAHYWRD